MSSPPADPGSRTRVVRRVNAPPNVVYRALLDGDAVEKWRVPAAMKSRVHEFDAREGGRFRVSLTYDAPSGAGKTSAQTDTYHGHFARLVPDETIVEVLEFESDDPAMRGEMTITTTLRAVDGGTEIVGVHEDLPAGVKPEDNETGWNEAFDRLAALLESGWRPRS
jgi:uncharacterized protein YndB with AHSA1/START domain